MSSNTRASAGTRTRRRETPSAGPRPCLFCDITRGTVESPIVFEDEVALAFLDHRPLFPGHCLLVPREHYGTIAELPASRVGPLFAAVRLLAAAVERAFEADGSFVALNNRVSQSVPHLHVHVVPRRFKDGLRGFFWPRQRYRDERAVRQAQAAIRAAIQALQQGSPTTRRRHPLA
jgi:histidine triad (HIT) family protein